MSLEREVAEHGIKIDNIEKTVNQINEKLDPVFKYVIEDQERERLRQAKRDWAGLVTSGGIAAILGSVVTWLVGR